MVGVERVGGIGIRLAEIVSWVLPSSSNGSRSSITLILSPVVAAFAFLYGLVSKQASRKSCAILRAPGNRALGHCA